MQSRAAAFLAGVENKGMQDRMYIWHNKEGKEGRQETKGKSKNDRKKERTNEGREKGREGGLKKEGRQEGGRKKERQKAEKSCSTQRCSKEAKFAAPSVCRGSFFCSRNVKTMATTCSGSMPKSS